MNSNPLDTWRSVTLDGSGNGSVSLGPEVGQRWTINVASVRVSSNTNEPICRIYMGSTVPIEGNFVDGTFSGSQDSTDRVSGIPLYAGQKIIAVWTGGDVGAQATLALIGIVDTGYRS